MAGKGKWMFKFALLFALCAILLKIPLPAISPQSEIPLAEIRAAVLFLIIGFYLGYIWNIKRLQELKIKLLWDNLSTREKEVAALLLDNKTYREIGDELFIGQNTVKSHIKTIYKKTKCGGREEFKVLFSEL